jgi:hypothetical protein
MLQERTEMNTAETGASEDNAFAMAQRQLDDCAARLRLEPSIHAILRKPARELTVTRLPLTARW